MKKAQVVPKLRKDSHAGSGNDVKKLPVKNRLERWKATGVVALSECNLEVINCSWFYYIFNQIILEILGLEINNFGAYILM